MDSSAKLCFSKRPGNSGTVLAAEEWDLRSETSWELKRGKKQQRATDVTMIQGTKKYRGLQNSQINIDAWF